MMRVAPALCVFTYQDVEQEITGQYVVLAEQHLLIGGLESAPLYHIISCHFIIYAECKWCLLLK